MRLSDCLLFAQSARTGDAVLCVQNTRQSDCLGLVQSVSRAAEARSVGVMPVQDV